MFTILCTSLSWFLITPRVHRNLSQLIQSYLLLFALKLSLISERETFHHVFASQLTSLFGDLECEPRVFEVARVKKEISKFSASSDKHGSEQQVNAARSPSTISFDPSDFTKKWDTPYGTGPKDIDADKNQSIHNRQAPSSKVTILILILVNCFVTQSKIDPKF